MRPAIKFHGLGPYKAIDRKQGIQSKVRFISSKEDSYGDSHTVSAFRDSQTTTRV